jgi:hypothetical protein
VDGSSANRDVAAYEAECLAEVKEALTGPKAPKRKQIRSVALEGNHPRTHVVVDWLDDQTTRVHSQEWHLWEPDHGLVGDPWRAPTFIANVIWANLDES